MFREKTDSDCGGKVDFLMIEKVRFRKDFPQESFDFVARRFRAGDIS